MAHPSLELTAITELAAGNLQETSDAIAGRRPSTSEFITLSAFLSLVRAKQ